MNKSRKDKIEKINSAISQINLRLIDFDGLVKITIIGEIKMVEDKINEIIDKLNKL